MSRIPMLVALAAAALLEGARPAPLYNSKSPAPPKPFLSQRQRRKRRRQRLGGRRR